jgi:hypothetical protein
MDHNMDMVREEVDRSGWEQRELYARFGVAVYQCQVFETTLVNFVALLRGNARGFGLTDSEHDELFDELFGRTLGRNLNEARRLLGPAAVLLDDTEEVLDLRNDLVHHWLRDRALKQNTSEERLQLIEELKDAERTITAANRKVQVAFRRLWENLGLSWGLIEDEYRTLGGAITRDSDA